MASTCRLPVLFTLDAFDAELARATLARDATPLRGLLCAMPRGADGRRIMACLALVGHGLLPASLSNPAPGTAIPTTPPLIMTAGMTFNGMTLDDFAARMDMPADHPYLVAMFIALCATEDPGTAMTR